MDTMIFEDFKLNVERDGRSMLYLQIRDWFRGKIISGELKTDEILPNQEDLSKLLGVNHVTLRQGLDLLKEEGLITRKPRVGSYIESKKKWRLNQKTLRLGILLGDTKIRPLQESYLGEVYSNICSESLDKGMDAISLKYSDENLLKKIKEYNLNGVIAFPSYDKNVVSVLSQLNLPKIMIELETRVDGLDNLLIDSQAGVYAGMQELIKLGHKKIFYVGGILGSKKNGKFRTPQDSLYRMKAYREALEEASINYESDWIHEISYEEEDAEAYVESLMNLPELPSAILGFDDKIIFYLYESLKKRNIKCPQDISLLGFGNHCTKFNKGDIATVEIEWKNLARNAIDRISERLENGGMGGLRLMIKTHFLPGKSIGPISK